MRRVDDKEPLALYVYKTMTDPFAGRISFFKVVSGLVKNETSVRNFTRQEPKRLAHLSIMQGRKAVEVSELHAGDLGAADFAEVLRPIWLAKPETASRVKQRCHAVMKWCAGLGNW